MADAMCQTICWVPTWNEKRKGIGLEHLLLRENTADSVVLAFDEETGPFRLTYRLTWDKNWQLGTAELVLSTEQATSSLSLHTEGQGNWHNGAGKAIEALSGCRDIDIWPTPFTNSFPILREPLAMGERREFLMAWVDVTKMAIQPQLQAYTRLAETLYLFENLDGSGFKAELPVDEHGIVLDYPELFQRVSYSG